MNRHASLEPYKSWHRAALAGMQYVLFETGPVTSNVVEGGAFWFADKGLEVPDLQFHFLAAAGAATRVPGVPAGSSGISLTQLVYLAAREPVNSSASLGKAGGPARH